MFFKSCVYGTKRPLENKNHDRNKKSIDRALASVAQLVGPPPAKQKVAGVIPGQGT